MDSTLSLTGSVVIGGIFLLGLMRFYGGVIDYKHEKNFQLLAQETTASYMEIIEQDFRKIGSGTTSPAIAITGNNLITFWGDVNGDGVADEVQYSLSDSSAASSTPNPNDRILYRDVNGARTLDTPGGVTDFSVTLLDELGDPTTELMNVSQIQLSITVESIYPYDGQYVTAIWQERIIPLNLVRINSN
ncbi:hypothetical protein GWN42_32905 [candidate division KSB1 bacterium]|nr:hypothetical protein [candidate division KSB1 bacterium]